MHCGICEMGILTPYTVVEICHHWFSYGLVVSSAPHWFQKSMLWLITGHAECWHIVDLALKNKFLWNMIKVQTNSFRKMYIKCFDGPFVHIGICESIIQVPFVIFAVTTGNFHALYTIAHAVYPLCMQSDTLISHVYHEFRYMKLLIITRLAREHVHVKPEQVTYQKIKKFKRITK